MRGKRVEWKEAWGWKDRGEKDSRDKVAETGQKKPQEKRYASKEGFGAEQVPPRTAG